MVCLGFEPGAAEWNVQTAAIFPTHDQGWLDSAKFRHFGKMSKIFVNCLKGLIWYVFNHLWQKNLDKQQIFIVENG